MLPNFPTILLVLEHKEYSALVEFCEAFVLKVAVFYAEKLGVLSLQ